jgi:ubiquitin carboxyl-terminal hydrolase 7
MSSPHHYNREISLAKQITKIRIQVQAGGAFDVDYEVVGPNERSIMKGERERQGDFVFTANDVGEYRFCFNNEMSTFAEKIVDFEIAVKNSPFFT